MDRRRFIKDVAMFSAGVASTIPVFKINPAALAAENAAPVVGVAEGTDWGALVARSLEPLGGMKAFVKPGAKVVIKPNASFDRTPEQGSNVHPDVLRAVIELCLAADPSEVAVFDRTLAEERRCWESSGIGAMLESIDDDRLKQDLMSDRKFVPVKIEGGIAFKNWQFYKKALEADTYINVPVAKHHGSAKLTLGLKNILGIIGGNRGKIHVSLDQGIVDLNTVVRSHLTVIDATRILLRNGPGGGNLEDVETKNTVISSADIVAADAYAAKTLFDMDPSELAYVKIANKTGLGESDLERIKVIKS